MDAIAKRRIEPWLHDGSPRTRGWSTRTARHYPFRRSAVCQALAGGEHRRGRQDIPGIDRLLALTDGVVAIALTLLVLQLQVPVTDALTKNPDSAQALWHALNPDGAELTSYLVSFVVIAQFWIVHHRVLRGMRGSQRRTGVAQLRLPASPSR